MKKIIFSKKYVTATPITGMIANWQMENNVLDSVGTNNATATAITYAVGQVGQCAVFNGSSSLIDAQYSAFDFYSSTKYSFVAVIKLNALPSSGNIYHPMMIQNGSSTGTFDKGFRIFSDGSVGFFAFDGAGKTALSASGIIAINTWYVLTGVFTGTSLNLYVDNVLVGTVACSGSFNHASPRLVLGHVHSGSSVAINGRFDEVAVFNDSLTTGQILTIVTKINNGEHLI